MKKSQYRYRIKLHLSRGKFYRYWQIREGKHEPIYLDPEQNNLLLQDCFLSNSPKIAEKILLGANRQPIAYIYFNSFSVENVSPAEPETNNTYRQIFYNPKKAVNWYCHYDPNIDNTRYREISTVGRKVYINLRKEEPHQKISYQHRLF